MIHKFEFLSQSGKQYTGRSHKHIVEESLAVLNNVQHIIYESPIWHA